MNDSYEARINSTDITQSDKEISDLPNMNNVYGTPNREETSTPSDKNKNLSLIMMWWVLNN